MLLDRPSSAIDAMDKREALLSAASGDAVVMYCCDCCELSAPLSHVDVCESSVTDAELSPAPAPPPPPSLRRLAPMRDINLERGTGALCGGAR